MKDLNGKPIQLGTLIQDTLRNEDLIPAFTDELERRNPVMLEAIMEGHKLESDNTDDYLSALQDALGEDLPDYVYFGCLPGNSSDFGYWVDMESVEQDCCNGELQKVNDTSEVKNVLLVNDHGNATLYVVSLTESWSIV